MLIYYPACRSISSNKFFQRRTKCQLQYQKTFSRRAGRFLNDLLSSALSAGSQKLYSRAWTVFRDFYEHFVSPHSIKLPLSTATITLFISYLRARKLAASTITSYLSAISYVHKMKGLRDPTKAFLIQKLLIAVSKQRSPDTRLPIFRIGELASKSPESGDSVVQFKSLSFLSMDGCIRSLKITICHLKHNTSNRPVDIIIARDSASPFCPVQAMLDYCKVRSFSPGPLFYLHNRPITVNQFNAQLRSCLSFCSLDSSRYKSHSFRIGAACHAAVVKKGGFVIISVVKERQFRVVIRVVKKGSFGR